MFSIGPYTFTKTDAQRTVKYGDEIFDLYGIGRDPSVIEHLRPKLTGDLEADLEAVWTAWTSAGPALRAFGQLPAQRIGRVAQLNVSPGGLPKMPVDSIEVGWRGPKGDKQKTRVHHGRPWQALCLWSREVIDNFKAQGHPLEPGFAGENVTIEGLDWSDVCPGVRMQIGDVLCELTAYALPCFQNKPFFLDADFDVIHHERGPVSRIYATVLRPGTMHTDDLVVLEP
jgi:MOSC domain-containing protein YiiM